MKISIIGSGAVGVEIITYLLNLGSLAQIVLVNRTKAKAEAEILDFSHVSSFAYSHSVKLSAGDYCDSKDSDIVIITAGAQIKANQTRDELLSENSGLIVDIIQEVETYSPNAIVIIVTNPVDVLTYIAYKNSSYPKERIFSAGTVVDTARFMKIVSDKINIDPKNIFGFVLGEHGKGSMIPWSICNICGLEVDVFCDMNDLPRLDKKDIEKAVLEVGLEIFRKKANTNHGIAASIYRLIKAIVHDENSVLPVGVFIEDVYGLDDVVLNIPVVINKSGIAKVLKYKLSQDELEELQNSASKIKNQIGNI